jgi:hypothetical protein
MSYMNESFTLEDLRLYEEMGKLKVAFELIENQVKFHGARLIQEHLFRSGRRLDCRIYRAL